LECIPKPLAIRQLLGKYSDDLIMITGAEIDVIHKVFVEDMVDFYANDRTVGEKEGVSETFALLKKNNIKVAVNTGFDRKITNVLLRRLGWEKDGLIDFSVTSDEVLRGRPFPDMILKAMRRFQISDALSVAKVGDTPVDLQEGNAAGCGLVIGVVSGAFSRSVLLEEKHTHLISSIPEILPILNLRLERQSA
jgi:phosphonatase-like hydrolase